MNTSALKTLEILIIQWAKEKGLLTDVDPERIDRQEHKVLEELGETAKAYLKQDQKEIIDGLGDTAVTVIVLNAMKGNPLIFEADLDLKGENSMMEFAFSLSENRDSVRSNRTSMMILSQVANKLGYKLADCVFEAYSIIKDRTGNIVNGTFIKDKN